MFHFRYLPLLAVALSVTLTAGCVGSDAVVPPSPNKSLRCGVPTNSVSRAIDVLSPLCGSTGGGYAYEGDENGYGVYSRTDSSTTFSGYTTTPSLSTEGTSTASITTDAYDGTVTATVNDPNLSTVPIQVQYINGHFLVDGWNAEPSGASLYKDSVNNVAYGIFTDSQGIAWRADGTVDSNGTSVDVVVTNSRGQSFSGNYPAAIWAPSYGSAVPLAEGRAPLALKQMKDAARVAVVAGVVSGVMLTFAAGAALVPGGQLIAGYAGLAGAAAGLVSVTAAAIDYNEKQKSGAKC